MIRTIAFNKDARTKLKAGVDKLANAVKVTLGPRGRNVAIDTGLGAPIVTKDGVTVAREIELKDQYENLGAQIVKEAASKQSDVAGDGTTTATLLAQTMYTLGLEAVEDGQNPMLIKQGIDNAVSVVNDFLQGQSRLISNDIDKIAQVATISANGDVKLGKLIAEAVHRVGKDGIVTIAESITGETSIEIVEGMRFDKGYVSPYFATDQGTMQTIMDDPLILITDHPITDIKVLIPILEETSQAGKTLLIIGASFGGTALQSLIANKMRGTLRVAAVTAPGIGYANADQLKDIAILTDGKFVSAELQMKLESITMEDLGVAKRVTIDAKTTTIVCESKPDVVMLQVGQITLAEHCIRLRQQIGNSEGYPKKQLEGRLAKLMGGVAVISVGAPTEVEMKEKKDRVDDALNATRAAVAEGIIPGGGATLLRAINKLMPIFINNVDNNTPTELLTGTDIVQKALEAPIAQIAENAGVDPFEVISTITTGTHPETPNFGWDARENRYGDLLELGVIDPTKVVRVALINAASIAGMLLTTEAAICFDPSERRKNQ